MEIFYIFGEAKISAIVSQVDKYLNFFAPVDVLKMKNEKKMLQPSATIKMYPIVKLCNWSTSRCLVEIALNTCFINLPIGVIPADGIKGSLGSYLGTLLQLYNMFQHIMHYTQLAELIQLNYVYINEVL